MLLIWIVIFFNTNLFFWGNQEIKENKKVGFHNWKIISEILNNDNYIKLWINPEKYETFVIFLEDFKSYSWVLIDPLNEKFVIWLKSDTQNDITFIPFNIKESKDIFKDSNNKNLAIIDIYKAYKSDSIYGWENSKYMNKILFENDFQHPKTNELNKIFAVNIFDQSNNVYDIINSFKKSKEVWISNTELLAYLNDFIWNYDEASSNRSYICIKYNSKCDNNIVVDITWKVLDSKWIPLPWVKIELLNKPENYAITNSDWIYSFKFKYYNFAHLRFKSSLSWYSDWFSTVSLNDNHSNKKNYNIEFKMHSADNSYNINNTNITKYIKWRYYIIEDEQSKYFIPTDWLYKTDWTNYTDNNFDIYTYLFTKESNMDSMLENDTFEPVYWYVWNIMKTFGMQYIQFVDKNTWEELYIKSSNPMILQNQIYHMKELYENSDNIYEKLTKEDMKVLVEKSKEWWYPIDFEYLTKNNFLRWPAWWSLDRISWIWSNVWSKVINVDWLVELPFYHIKDN